MDEKKRGRRKGCHKTGGRKKGTLNRTTQQLGELCRSLTLGNQKFIDRLKVKIENFDVDTTLLIRLIEYGYGKPRERVTLSTDSESPLTIEIIEPNFTPPDVDNLEIDATSKV